MGVTKKGAPHHASHNPVRGFLCVFASLREPSVPLARPQRAMLRGHATERSCPLPSTVTICCSKTTSPRTNPYLDLTALGFRKAAIAGGFRGRWFEKWAADRFTTPYLTLPAQLMLPAKNHC
jgi:hypothetical protein